jgi:hypothetical protein
VYLIEIKLGQHARIEDLPAAPLRKDRKSHLKACAPRVGFAKRSRHATLQRY